MSATTYYLVVLAGGAVWFLVAFLVGKVIGKWLANRENQLDIEAALHREETWK